MTRLRIFADDAPDEVLETHEAHANIVAALDAAGIRFERWEATSEVGAGASQDEVIEAYRADIDRLMTAEGYRSVDVVSMTPDHPDKAVMRGKFLDEHTHAEDEVRFFVDGRGLFTLHLGDRVYEVLCERGDLIGVPAGTRHWFDMGDAPSFVAIRLFTSPDGWAADFTGSDIALRFPRLAA